MWRRLYIFQYLFISCFLVKSFQGEWTLFWLDYYLHTTPLPQSAAAAVSTLKVVTDQVPEFRFLCCSTYLENDGLMPNWTRYFFYIFCPIFFSGISLKAFFALPFGDIIAYQLWQKLRTNVFFNLLNPFLYITWIKKLEILILVTWPITTYSHIYRLLLIELELNCILNNFFWQDTR